MFELASIDHHIKRHIMAVLMYQETARFRDLRPPRTDTNLFSYHLNGLIRSGMMEKNVGGYQLSASGLAYVDRVSTEKNTIRSQPKIITMLLVQNSDGDVLIQKRTKQPYINAWTLPYGKVHIDDRSVDDAASREAYEKLGLTDQPKVHIGDCYIRVTGDDAIMSTTLAHVFRFDSDDVVTSDTIQWARPHKLRQYRLAPAVESIVARGFFNDPFFFEEFNEHWTTPS
ncbi:MAG: hypothetical protein JWN33_85 [Candidatus Saccharibacteria bacterium]|nr:hypothetical protein [Candidatus Saccharibacteria bacterium]